MDCREILERLGELSADCLPCAKTCEEVRAHLEQCGPCHEEWLRYEQMLLLVSGAAQPISNRVQAQAMWSVCLEKIVEDVEKKRTPAASPFWNWVASQPGWNWAALGGAVAVLGGVWLYGPQAEAPAFETPQDARNARVIMFQDPPAGSNSFINRHAAMSFDGFNDHVGSTLVSYSATAPSPGVTVSAAGAREAGFSGP